MRVQNRFYDFNKKNIYCGICFLQAPALHSPHQHQPHTHTIFTLISFSQSQPLTSHHEIDGFLFINNDKNLLFFPSLKTFSSVFINNAIFFHHQQHPLQSSLFINNALLFSRHQRLPLQSSSIMLSFFSIINGFLFTLSCSIYNVY